MDWTPHVGEDVVVLVDDDESPGRIVEDFGELPDVPADTDVAAPRRWAITTADGGLVFADTADLRQP
ncbi:hypothetical protein ACXVUM_06500 [Williamsia sp. SKLECPSW1]